MGRAARPTPAGPAPRSGRSPTGCARRPPGGERDAPARPQHAARLAQRRAGVGGEHVAPAAQHPVHDAVSRSIHSSSSTRELDVAARAPPRGRARRRPSPPSRPTGSATAGRDQLGGEQARCPGARRRARAPFGPGWGATASISHCETGARGAGTPRAASPSRGRPRPLVAAARRGTSGSTRRELAERVDAGPCPRRSAGARRRTRPPGEPCSGRGAGPAWRAQVLAAHFSTPGLSGPPRGHRLAPLGGRLRPWTVDLGHRRGPPGAPLDLLRGRRSPRR